MTRHLTLIEGGRDLAEQWMIHAACAGTHRDVFFPENGAHVRPAKALCARCPVRDACLEYALNDPALHIVGTGVWGGTTPPQRRRLARLRRLGGAA